MSYALYQYRGKAVRVVDGDTVELDVDFGATIRMVVISRLYGINAPEVHGLTADVGKAATVWMVNALYDDAGFPIKLWVRSNLRDKYGRLLVTLWDHEPVSGDEWETSVNARMVAEGFAVPMAG